MIITYNICTLCHRFIRIYLLNMYLYFKREKNNSKFALTTIKSYCIHNIVVIFVCYIIIYIKFIIKIIIYIIHRNNYYYIIMFKSIKKKKYFNFSYDLQYSMYLLYLHNITFIIFCYSSSPYFFFTIHIHL